MSDSLLQKNYKKCIENAEKCDTYFDKLIEQRVSPCFTVSVCRNDELVYEYYNGYSSTEPNAQQIDKSTRFNIASVTKPITGSLIVKLIEKGALTSNDLVKRYIPEYPFSDVAIYHLLTHSAGYDLADHPPHPQNSEQSDIYLKQLYDIRRRINIPGEVSGYFTGGYSILMDILERVSGETIESFARHELFSPLKMDLSTYDLKTLKLNDAVMPWDEEIKKMNDDVRLVPPTGDSGLYTTSYDLARFGQMILNRGKLEGRQIFTEAAVDFMTRELFHSKTINFWRKGSRTPHEYGCFGDFNSPDAIGHTGATGCMLMIDPYYRISAAIITNSLFMHRDWRYYQRICNVILTMQ